MFAKLVLRRVAGVVCLSLLLATCLMSANVAAAEPTSVTTLGDTSIQYQVADGPYVILERADVRAVIVDNHRVDDEVLVDHQAGYNGVASLTHNKRSSNLFVPYFSGFNFEAIHDGRTRELPVLFEPRNAPMELRVIDDFTCELYQEPTPNWQLESCHRYHMLPDGALEITFECKPGAKLFKNGFIGLQWASYIYQPESPDIFFKGRPAGDGEARPRWIRGHTPNHGKLSTHLGTDDRRVFRHDADFPFTLLFSRSNYRYTEPWYFGISKKMALVKIFRPQDQIRLTQSPSGGGFGNPAWDYQLLISPYEPGSLYQMVMRVVYTPFESVGKLEQLTRAHRIALGHDQ